ncbi:MAG: glycosyltransferase [Rubrivivax sp.]|nr:MAG: glycosyltransferase [Rubrivivax sp.]
MKSVGIFRTSFPIKSEAFIREQARHLTAWRPHIITRRRQGPSDFPLSAIGDEHSRRLQQLLWTITRWPGFMPLSEFSDIKLVHAHFAFDAVMALPMAKKLGVPLIVTLHGCDATIDISAYKRSTRITEQWFAHSRPVLQREAGAFIAVSKFIENHLLQVGYPRERVIQHYIGTDTERFTPVTVDPNAQRYVLNVARHADGKGVSTVLRAWARIASKHPDVQLWQAGDGELMEEHLRLSAELGLGDRVRFIGGLDHAQVLPLMQNATAFCLGSHTTKNGLREALGIVLNEASACALPIVATRVGGIPEAVRHGETGLICEEQNPEQMAELLDAILSDPTLARRLGDAGRRFVCENFNIRTQSQKLQSIYDSVTAGRGVAHLQDKS